MNFLSIFKQTKKTGKETVVESKELIEDVETASNEDEVETALSFHPKWNIPQEQEYVFRFLSNELKPLKPNQISLVGLEVNEDEMTGNWLVKAFLRSSLDRPISMEEVELFIMDDNEQILARQKFDLAELGELPAKSARPWVFVFNQESLLEEKPPIENWTLAFNLQSMTPHRLDLEEAWEKGLTDAQKKSLKETVDGLPKLEPKEVNIVGFQVQKQEDGGIAASVFIRNGYEKSINIEQLPLELVDATGEVVAQGAFALENFEVKANTTKPWTFIYPKSMVKKEQLDFSRWLIRVYE